MVLCYHLQHPHLYSARGIEYGLKLLVTFMATADFDPQSFNRQQRGAVATSPNPDQNQRRWPITARPGDEGSYDAPVRWTLTAAAVVQRGAAGYEPSVREWAQSLLVALRAAGQVPAGPR
jgi:hypothetical protein